MAVITRTVNSIIDGAYKIIGLYSEERAMDQGRTTEALYYLNALLDQYASNQTRIAYDGRLSFNLVADQSEYIISKAIGADVDSNKIAHIKYITVTDGDFVWPVQLQPDDFYFTNKRDINQTGRPNQVFFQNEVNGSKLVFFTKPDKVYQCNIKGKFVLDAVELSQPLDEVPAYYHMFLEYALARILHVHYSGSNWGQVREDEYIRLLNSISDISDMDLSANTGASLKNTRDNYTHGDFLNGY
jgi:hypothetical protein